MNKRFENYSFFKGEQDCPFKDDDKFFWWRVERYAFENNDAKEPNELSETMCAYLRERHYLGDNQPSEDWNVALKRYTEMYRNGVWSKK